MLTWKKAFSSTVGRKFLMGLSGLLLVGFIFAHLAGNLTLLVPGGEAFNLYAKKLSDLGPLLYVMEVGLIFVFLLHIVSGVRLKIENKGARTQGYRSTRSKGGPSKSNVASINMIVTGVIILVFLVVHIWQFKFGPGMDDGYIALVDGKKGRDLYRLVAETFSNPLWAGFYVFIMSLLGMHLRHGFWSAFQSLGLAYPRYSKPIYLLAMLIAAATALGFIILPLYLYVMHAGV